MCNSYILFCLRNRFTHSSCSFLLYILFFFSILSFLIFFLFSSLLSNKLLHSFFPNHTWEKQRTTKKTHIHKHYTQIHTYTQKDRKKSTTMTNIVLICLTTNEQDFYGLARRLALITGRLVESSLTLKGLKYNE